MAVLDDLSGFEFEDLMEDVFRNLSYENVRQARRTADEGRDVLMEEVVDGTRRVVIVEYKHTGVVGRPVVQKLHSAIATFDFDGPRRGMIVTTGWFTGSTPSTTPSLHPLRWHRRLDETEPEFPAIEALYDRCDDRALAQLFIICATTEDYQLNGDAKTFWPVFNPPSV